MTKESRALVRDYEPKDHVPKPHRTFQKNLKRGNISEKDMYDFTSILLRGYGKENIGMVESALTMITGKDIAYARGMIKQALGVSQLYE